MKKLIILFILLTIFLSGCSILESDDLKFITLVKELDTPQKISDYMICNFTYEYHASYIDPYILWKTKKGDCSDFAVFAQFIANFHGYKTYKIFINFKGTSTCPHVLAIYSEDGKYTYSSNQSYYPLYASNFDDIVSHYFISALPKYELESYKVYDYDMNIIEQVYND